MIFVLFLYVIVALGSLYISKYEKRVNVAIAVAPVSLPLGIMTAIGIIFIWSLIFYIILLIILLLSSSETKIGAIIGSIAGAVFSFLGPIGWIIDVLIVVIIISSIWDTFERLYEWVFQKMSEILIKIRSIFNEIREKTSQSIHSFVILVEMALISCLSLYSVWCLLDIVDGKTEITTTIIIFRIIVLIPYALILYRSYIRDTNPPSEGGEGVNSPLLIEFSDFIDDIF